MAMHNKTISTTLMENSKISGVQIKNLSTNLSDIAHGLYIESIANDRYADLRLGMDKAFWGHTHPLWIQYQFGTLPNELSDQDYQAISKTDKEEFISPYSKLSLDDVISKKNIDKDSKYFLSLSEIDILNLSENTNEILVALEEISNKTELVIEEVNLLLLSNKQLFYTHQINCKKVLSLTFMDFSWCNFNIPTTENTAASQFYLALNQYMEYLVWGDSGKFSIDRNLINESLQNLALSNIRLFNNYIIIENCTIAQSEFLKQGLLISKHNFNNSHIVLAIPTSCTKEELLDTLERISNILKR